MTEHDDYPVSDVDLADFDDEFENSEAEAEFEPVPDGKYQVTVDRVELTRTKTSGKPMLKWALKIIGPSHAGRLLWRNNVIATKENIKWLKKDLYSAGLNIQKLSELPANLDQLLDVTLEITKRSRGEYEDIFINKRIKLAEEALAENAAAPDDGDDVPW